MANQTRLREVGIDLAVEFFGSICIAVGTNTKLTLPTIERE